MLTILDVAAAFTARFAAVVAGRTAPDGSNLISPVALYSRYYALPVAAGDTPRTPYATFSVRVEGIQEFGGAVPQPGGDVALSDAFLMDFGVRCRVSGDANWPATPDEIQAALLSDWQAKWGVRAGWTFPAGHALTVAKLADLEFGLYESLRNGSDSTYFQFDLGLQVAGRF